METSDSLFSKILANGPSPGTLFLVLSRMKEEGHLRKVIKECHHALDIYPDDIHIRRLLAETYLALGQIPQAESELDKVIARIDDLISSYGLKTEILLHQKREKEAVETLKIYLAHRPDDKEALLLLDSLEALEEISLEPETVVEEEAITEEPFVEKDELKDIIDQDQGKEDKGEDRIRQKKVRMINILEAWLANIREQSKTGLSVT